MASPVGIVLSKREGYSVGRKLGEGAQCAVHELLQNGKPTDYVVKCAPIPPPKKNPKAKPKLDEINANSINGEYHLYNGRFRHLHGDMIPKMGISGWLASFSVLEVDGYRFLVIERMECGLFQGIPKIVRRVDAKSPQIDIGPMAVRLLEIVETFHNNHHILVDIKADNIMFAHDQAKHTRKTLDKDISTLAKRVRVLDFGLTRLWSDGTSGRHNPNTVGGTLVGTPLYASRHVHEGNTPSRRDDVECMGIVLADLLIRIHAQMPGLPWANEKSDEAIGKMKLDMMADINSAFYKGMGNKAAAAAMYKYFEATWATEYARKPDYALLKSLFIGLQASIPKAESRSQSASSQTGARARGASIKQNPAKKPKVATHQAPAEDISGRRRSARIANDGVITINDEDDDGDLKPAALPTKTVSKPASASQASKPVAYSGKPAMKATSKAATGSASKASKPVAYSAKPAAGKQTTSAAATGTKTSSSKGKPAASTLGMLGGQKKTASSKLQEIPSCDDEDEDIVESLPQRRLKTTKEVATSTEECKATTKSIEPVAFRAAAARSVTRGVVGVHDMDDAMEVEPLDIRDDDEDDDSIVVYKGSYKTVMAKHKTAASGGGDKDDDDDAEMELDVENDVELATANDVAAMDIDPKFANKKLVVKVANGAQLGTKVIMSIENPTLLIGNGRVKSKDPMLALTMDEKIHDTHCKLVFGVTCNGTPRIVVTAKVDHGVKIKNTSLKMGKSTTLLRDSTLVIGNTSLYITAAA